MKVKELNEQERPREKALLYGCESLSNRELIAIVLRTGTRNHNVLEVADEVLALRKTLGEVAVLKQQDFMHVAGIRAIKAVELMAVFELGRRVTRDRILQKTKVEHPGDIVQWLNQEIGFEQQEHFMVLFLNQKNEIMNYKVLFVGTLTQANVHPREIFKEAMQQGCAKIICVHNHPSGDPTPSKADIDLTRVIQHTGEMIAIPLVDHIIVAANSYISFRQKRLID